MLAHHQAAALIAALGVCDAVDIAAAEDALFFSLSKLLLRLKALSFIALFLKLNQCGLCLELSTLYLHLKGEFW